MLANRQGQGEAFAELDSFAEMERRVEESGVDDETYLEASGVDTDAVAAAEDRVEQGTGGSQSREATVRAALRDLEAPSEGKVIAYAKQRGVPADYTRTALEKLVRAGEVTTSDGSYRLL